MSEIVESYAHGLSAEKFWNVFFRALDKATQVIKDKTTEKTFTEGNNEDAKERVDYFAFRQQMIKLMHKFPSLAERKSRTLSPFLIELYRLYYQINMKFKICLPKKI